MGTDLALSFGPAVHWLQSLGRLLQLPKPFVPVCKMEIGSGIHTLLSKHTQSTMNLLLHTSHSHTW